MYNNKSPRIFLIRHGESESNVDKRVHFTVPDHAIGLSDLGKEQAIRAGKALVAELVNAASGNVYTYYDDAIRRVEPYSLDGKFALWMSPYKRTRQTAKLIEEEMYSILPSNRLVVNEHINLVEQQFGLFDGYSDEELRERYPAEWSHYNKCESFEGRFWARMPLGESRFDVAVRVHQFFGTLMRDLEKHNIENIIIVSHGVTNRAFVMQWLHHPFEWFEKEKNPQNCSIRRIDGDRDMGYIHSGG